MVRLVPMGNDAIPMILLVQNNFAFTPSRDALIIIMNIPHSISQPRNDKFASTPSRDALIIIMNIARSISQLRNDKFAFTFYTK